jgi:hypothetical protein
MHIDIIYIIKTILKPLEAYTSIDFDFAVLLYYMFTVKYT